MKLKDVKWIAVHFDGRGILSSDKRLYPRYQWEKLLNFEVEPMTEKGHYMVV